MHIITCQMTSRSLSYDLYSENVSNNCYFKKEALIQKKKLNLTFKNQLKEIKIMGEVI